MGSAEVVSGKRQVALHVVEQHPLAANYLRSVLRGLPGATFHSRVPASLASEGPVVLVIDAGTLAVPLGEFLHSVRIGEKSGLALGVSDCLEVPFHHLCEAADKGWKFVH
jgi:hypothetical protein